MKKTITLLLFLLSISTYTDAQLQFAPFIGVNMAHYKLDAGFIAFSASSKPGILAGAIADIPIGGHFYLQPGAQFVSSSYDLNYTLLVLTGTINTIQMPINVLYKVGSEINRKLYFWVGLYGAMNIVAKERITSSGFLNTLGVPAEIDSVHNLQTVDFGICATAGYQFSKHFFAQAHFQRSYAHLFMDFPGFDIKNYNFGAGIGYFLGGRNR